MFHLYMYRQSKRPKSFEARIANVPYLKSNVEREKDADEIGLDYDEELSDNYTSVLYDKKNNKSYVAFRGTNSLKDMVDNFDVILNRQNQNVNFNQARVITDKAKKKYGVNPVVVGHSLGGAKSLYVNEQTGYDAIVFNPLMMPYKKPGKNVQLNRKSGDFASLNMGLFNHSSWQEALLSAAVAHPLATNF